MIALAIAALIAFLTTLITTPYIKNFLIAVGVMQYDLHKKVRVKLPASGGLCVALGIIFALLAYVGMKTFVYGANSISTLLLAVVSSILLVAFSGLLDDLNVKSRAVETKDGKNIKVGFPQWIKPLLTLPAAIPLMVLGAGETSMAIPIIGLFNFGILYPLLLIPIGFIAASNMVNLLGGFNGAETGMGILYCLSLGVYALVVGSMSSAVIFLTTAAALLGFVKYNWFPAKILPGDSLTYLLGAVVASGVIIGNMETVGVIVMTPFIIEFLLKARSRFKASSLGKLGSDGKLDPPYGKKVYSLSHVVINLGRFTERQVTMILIAIEAVFCALIFLYPLVI